MITFSNWTIRNSGDVLARQYDHLSRTLLVSGVPDGYSWRMLVRAGGSGEYFDIIALFPMENGVGAVLTRDQLSVSGDYEMQLQGTLKADGETVCHSNTILVNIPPSMTGDAKWPAVPSEFTQIERRVQAQAELAEESSNTAVSAMNTAVKASNSAVSAKETAVKAQLTATTAESMAKAYAESAGEASAEAFNSKTVASQAAETATRESTLASASATNAADAAAKAAGSAESASGYLSSVQEAANAAKASETAAKASETAAKASETAAKASETAAKDSETAANTSAERAQNAKDAVVELYSAVKSNASATEEAKASAMESADEAAESASVAYSNANRAETAAAAAEEASTLASAAASNADDAAARAQDSAGEAAASAANAKASAEAAAASASNAKASAEAAATSAAQAAESAANAGKTFVATYGVTTTDEIYAAYQAGKAIFCNYNGMLASLYTIEKTDEAVFLYHTDAGMYSISADPSGWSYEYRSAVDTTLTVSGKAADAAAVGARLSSLSEEKADKEYISLKKYGITAIDYEAPFTTEMYEVAYANGKGFQKAIDDAKADGRKAIVIPNGNYPLCWAGGEGESNPVIVADGVDIYGNGSRLYVIFDEDGTNPYFTGENPYNLSGTVIETNAGVDGLHIVGERAYRITNPGRMDDSSGIGLTEGCHGNTIKNCTIEKVSGDGISCTRAGIQLAHWGSEVFESVEWNGSDYVASKYNFASQLWHSLVGNDGTYWVDITQPMTINSTPNFMYSTEAMRIRCFDADKKCLGEVRAHQGEYFYFFPGTVYWKVELTRIVEHAEDATETWNMFLRQGYYSGTKIINCICRFNQRGGMSNLPDKAVVDNCQIYHNGSSISGMVAYYDGTRFGIDQEEIITSGFTVKDTIIYGQNQGILFRSCGLKILNSTIYGLTAGVSGLNGCVDFYAENCDIICTNNTYGGACSLNGAASHGEKLMVSCRVVGKIMDNIVVIGGTMAKAIPVSALDNSVASTDYVWIGNDMELPSSDGGINITGATVGQTVRISEVDENGTPTVWEPVDLPTGGASSTEEWVKIADYTWTDEDAAATTVPALVYTTDVDGNDLSIDAMYIVCDAKTNSTRTLYGMFSEGNNINYTIKAESMFVNGKLLIVYNELKKLPVPHAVGYAANGLVGGNGGATAKYYLKHFNVEGQFVYPAKAIRIFPSGQILAGSTFSIWGRVAK